MLSLAFIYVKAKSYGGYGGEGVVLSTGTGYAQPALRAVPVGLVNAAVQSTRTVEFIPLNVVKEIPAPQVIEVEPYEQPVHLIFKSSTSPLLVSQFHQKGAPAQHEATRSEEETSHLLHEVYKPVVQEFREVIQPFRKITQEVKPVVEEVRTIVAKGEGHQQVPLQAEHIVPATPVLVREDQPVLANKY